MSAPLPESRPTPAPAPLPRRVGQVAQGLVLGMLLVLALFELLAKAGDITPFKYQGF